MNKINLFILFLFLFAICISLSFLNIKEGNIPRPPAPLKDVTLVAGGGTTAGKALAEVDSDAKYKEAVTKGALDKINRKFRTDEDKKWLSNHKKNIVSKNFEKIIEYKKTYPVSSSILDNYTKLNKFVVDLDNATR